MDNKRITFFEHIIELRKRIVIAGIFFVCSFCLCYYFAAQIYEFLLIPLTKLTIHRKNFTLIYTGLTETFFVYLRVAVLSATLFSFPVFIWQFYMFLAPGLYAKEKAVLLPYLLATPVLFALGIAVVYYYIFPLAWQFFLSFEYNGNKIDSPSVALMPSVAQYLDLVVQLMLAFGLAFQLPVILTFTVQIGLLTTQTLVKKRKLAIVIIFIAAAILTPPDVFSQIGLAIPMLILYELTILACKYVTNKCK